MKIHSSQQQEIHRYLKHVAFKPSTVDELFDHIMTDLEQRPANHELDMQEVKRFIDAELDTMINTDRDSRRYHRINNIAGLIVFLFALSIYWMTMAPTVSFWDCGEFIAAAFKLEVGHQPGAPFFVLIGKLFSFLALGEVTRVAYWVNFCSVVCSAATIMFLFWTITALVSKVCKHEKIRTHIPSIIGAGVIGALAYTFSDTFWFSAVEAEVYALSSLCTAITFWAVLKWERHLNDRWLVFIAFMIGLSTGVHLLSLLTIPAIVLVYYYRKTNKATRAGTIKAFLAGLGVLLFVQFGVLQYVTLSIFKMDLLFVNGFGLPFGSGAIGTLMLLATALFLGIHFSIRTRRYKLNRALLCMAFLLFGFGSYTMIILRASAKPAINLSNPDNAYSLYDYLRRDNYGSTPLLYGNTFDAERIGSKTMGNTYRKGQEKYEVSGNDFKPIYDKNMLFPRMYSQQERHVRFYQEWMGLSPGQTPSFAQNLGFFTSWQVGVMYWRYFLWNFSGRQNDLQGYGGAHKGNWITGIKAIDAMRLGNRSQLPPSITANAGHNVFYGLPFLLGIAGIYWLFRKNKRTVLVLSTLFVFTGLAIIVYLNQTPLQVRERDYAYAGSFYAFAIFIGFGFLWVKDIFQRFVPARTGWSAALIACLFGVPFLMGSQGWDDHDRSGRTTARDWAKNYLNSCAPNAILFTNADNDTYPLWYAQEVEGIRPDVRVVNYQFLHDASFIDQLKTKVNASEPLPISLDHETYREGERGYFPYVDYGISDSVELKDLIAVMASDNPNDQVQASDGTYLNFVPTRRLKLSIDADHLLDTQTISGEQKQSIVSAMKWDFEKPFASKADLLLYDIIATNNWERPIYFATSVSEDTYMGLEDYLYLEGYAYRLLPIKKPSNATSNEMQRTHTPVMYRNVMNRMDYTSFKKAKHLDVESRRIINSTWQLNNVLAGNLLQEGKKEKARQVLKKSLDALPLRNYSIVDTVSKLHTAQNLYGVDMAHAGNDLVKTTSDFIKAELGYIQSLTPARQAAYREDIRIGLYVLDGFQKIASLYQQPETQQRVSEILERTRRVFSAEG